MLLAVLAISQIITTIAKKMGQNEIQEHEPKL